MFRKETKKNVCIIKEKWFQFYFFDLIIIVLLCLVVYDIVLRNLQN